MQGAIEVRNPHSILAALRKRPSEVQSILAPPKADAEAWGVIEGEAKKRRVPFQIAKQGSLAKAMIRQKPSIDLEDLIPAKVENGLWLALDCVQDPHNVGAIFRSAGFFGIQGMILLEDRAAHLSSVVYDVSSGGVEAVPFSFQTNLRQAIEFCKERGLWILGTSENAEMSLSEIPKDRAYLMILGNEEKGLRRLTMDSCDYLCRIDSKGDVKSLNVSVATGVALSFLTESHS